MWHDNYMMYFEIIRDRVQYRIHAEEKHIYTHRHVPNKAPRRALSSYRCLRTRIAQPVPVTSPQPLSSPGRWTDSWHPAGTAHRNKTGSNTTAWHFHYTDITATLCKTDCSRLKSRTASTELTRTCRGCWGFHNFYSFSWPLFLIRVAGRWSLSQHSRGRRCWKSLDRLPIHHGADTHTHSHI